MPTSRSATLTSAVILATFLLYFAFCYVAHLLTSRVERVSLPEIRQPLNWSTRPETVHVIISQSLSSVTSSEEFCNFLQDRLAAFQNEIAPIECRFQELPPIPDNPNSADLLLKEFVSADVVSWFFIDSNEKDHSITLGRFNHAWSIQGGLDQETWIDKSLDVFTRMIMGVDVHRLEHIQSQKSYLLSFSVLIEDPADIYHSWNFKQVVGDYLQPFLDHIRPVFNTRVDSQIIYYADIADHVQTNSDGSKFLSRSQLKDFMGRTKWNVESIHTPSFPALHFFIYIPLSIHTPLLFDTGSLSSSAFYIPRWGGLTIANALAKPNVTQDDFAYVMPVVLAQIRMMLGFPDPLWSSPNSDLHQIVSETGVAQWELRLMQKSRLQYNYYNGYEQLHALMRLLEENVQLPVQGHVGDLIEQAVLNLDRCMQDVQSGLYENAFDFCLDGYNAAHSAFFDETMLPLLYFPDEHVYAVYAPYFLSIFSVTISRTVQFIKSFRQKQ